MYLPRLRQGFTLIELLVVITVIAILVMITATIYQNVQVQARDTQLASAADKVADAVQLFIQQQGHFPRGGSGSTAAAAAGAECADGKDGWFAVNYQCDVEDTLINLGYLPSGFVGQLPSNTKYTGNNRQAIMIYRYDSGANAAAPYRAMVYYSKEDPSTTDTSHLNSQLTRCGLTSTTGDTMRTNYGMQDGICVSLYS